MWSGWEAELKYIASGGASMVNATETLSMRKSGMATLRAATQRSKAPERPEFPMYELLTSLQRRNRELSAYAHTVAHNLKGPLTVILAISDAIFRITDLTPEELQVYLQEVRSTAQSMDDMIDNMLLLGELNETDVPAAPLEMDGIVTRVRTRLSYLIGEFDARLKYPAEWPTAIGYVPWIEEVWSNLISNAVKYGGRPPCVELGAAVRPDGMVQFWVQDDGQGIAPESRSALFRPFTQLGPVRTPGHGLGLSIVRGIVEKLGGQVGVESEVGRGSRFFFALPASK
jgi:two-component system, sensor histidine kinase and response regulator